MDYALPPFPEVPKLKGRILIGGKMIDSGYETKEVFSTCHRGEKPVLLGITPHVTVQKLSEAVDAAALAWNKGLGDWPMARAEERVKAVVHFRDLMLKQREIVCRLLMWEIGKNWAD